MVKDNGGTGDAATVGGQEVHGGVPLPTEIDIVERDPEKMNQHLRLVFADVFAEPEPGTYSFDKIWVLSFQVFTATKLWTYRIATLLCAIPAAFCWGLQFACLTFHYIWCLQPAYRAFSIQMIYTRRIYSAIMNAYALPFFNAFGYLFSLKLWSYRILTLLFALPLAILWGVSYGCLSFSHIWCYVPCLRACRVNLHFSEKIFGLIMDSFVKPVFDAMGRVFSHVRVQNSSKKTTNFEDIHLA